MRIGDAMVARARERGVDAIVTVGCDVEDSLRACEVAERLGLSATVGIHPHEAKDAPDDLATASNALRERFGTRLVAVGETGLDYHYDHSPRDAQRRVFAAQLAYARARIYPLVFHQREAHDDFVAGLRAGLRSALAARRRPLLHRDAGRGAALRTRVRVMLGSAASSPSRPQSRCATAVREVGLDAIVLETDCPYLAPVPHRGKRNEVGYVADTARAVADVLGVDVATVVARTTPTPAPVRLRASR